ncbi:MAG: S41 family peptidase [Bdellovibrionota bacterium]
MVLFRGISARALFSVFLASQCFLVSSAFSAKKEFSEYWKETGISLKDVRGFINPKNCSTDKESFLGCVQGLNTMLAKGKPGLTLALDTHIQSKRKWLGKTVRSFGIVKMVELQEIKYASEVGTEERITENETLKKQGREDLVAWVSLFQKQGATALQINNIFDFAEKKIVKSSPIEMISATAINSYLGAAFDPHTYLSPAEYQADQRQSVTESFVGVGAVLQKRNGRVVIIQPIEGGAALEAGIRAKDVITHVNGEDVSDLDLEAVVAKIRGPEGTMVKLAIERKQQITLYFELKRRPVVTENVSSKPLEGFDLALGETGYIKLNSFSENQSCMKVAVELGTLLKRNVKRIILDLRENGGGLLSQATCISNLFLPRNKRVVFVKDIDTTDPEDESFEERTTIPAFTILPLVLLVDAGSASASEIVAGALQDHQRAFIVGARTFGKGTVQTPSRLKSNPKILKMSTTARFYLPSGRTNQIEGVIPDLIVYDNPNPSKLDTYAQREEDLYTNALPPEGSPWIQPRPSVIGSLKKCIDQGNQAQRRYVAHEDDALPQDYQVLYAQETLECWERMREGTVKEVKKIFDGLGIP